MSQSTNIHFYTCETLVDPLGSLEKTLALLEPQQIRVTRYNGSDSSWADLHDDQSEGPTYETLRKIVSVDQATGMYIPGNFLALDIISQLTKKLSLLVDRAIPESVRDDHWPHNLSLYIDPHDIFENAENTNGHFFARAFLSIKFWGYSTPRDIVEYRNRVLALPLVTEIRENLSHILDSVECQVYMNL